MTTEKVSRAKAVEAQCWECMGHYSDGKHDCECVRCPLYSFMPYRKKEPDLWWQEFGHRLVGKQHPTQGPPMSPERLEAMRAGKIAAQVNG